MKKSKNKLLIKTVTWNKDSNELLDYESQDVTKINFETNSEVNLYKRNDIIKMVPANEKVIGESKHKLLASVQCDLSKFFIKGIIDEKAQLFTQVNKPESPWIVLKHLYPVEEGERKRNMKNCTSGEGRYKIIPGDVIKLGRIKLKVVEIKEDPMLEDSIDNHTKHFATKYNDKSNLEQENAQKAENNININCGVNNEICVPTGQKAKNLCRICYCDEQEMDSPLIQPCSCSGTMAYIHFICLQKWLKSKVDIKTTTSDNCVCYSLKQVECELCKTLLPDYIKYKDKLYEIWDFKPRFKSYITFETFVTEKNTNRLLYVVNIENKQNIRIGRGHDSDIRVTDISVSRFHALIRKEQNGAFTIEDNNSKFGTLILMQNPRMPVLKGKSFPLQIGRTLFCFTLKKPFSLFSCFTCGKEKTESEKNYQTINAKFIDFEKCNYIKIQKDESVIQNLEDKNESVKNEGGFLKVIEAPENENPDDNPENLFILENGDIDMYQRGNIGNINLNHINSNSNSYSPGMSPNVMLNRNYLERANTNLGTNAGVGGQVNIMHAIKERLKNDLESLRRFDFDDNEDNNNSNSQNQNYNSHSHISQNQIVVRNVNTLRNRQDRGV